ncbi:MAG: CoA-binding protein [Candidatus Aquicultor secundus]|uniref:CoA-binding protein n=1 Tax=Candidatus Aquicultor secundus TaxID=1973895 RepID=A0A2M7T9D3_9ACTN|nr:CoA-binding protein [Candidatus Aquicultor secundus]NCO65945.1 CoA-binding protein [Solirubrobacter sp.]OIO86034.1 MAG: hypothetical protein AUK32_06080 [Candidatus Aquicultor secundus]PIU26758.1 MAG: CoA-binding protein [Candidatus Aquicultor secundus]PIW22917.1 MAG: CoA-binding protein [Candidatus Aquicultor secundus]PIX52603.1 MAG: CoA-binding protein [Candidatus Aquicultor secundus]
MEEELIRRAVKKNNIIAVVGASNNPDKYGYKIYEDLKSAGYKVYPVNAREQKVQGDKAYPTISSLPEKPDVVDIVTPPQVTENIVKEAQEQGIDIVWMQPGAESQEAITFCKQSGVKEIHNSCIMVARRNF